jgi:2,4-dienoyl-CoA reductase-like NADH-dependent reductase (Old Yellow Enzyme family)
MDFDKELPLLPLNRRRLSPKQPSVELSPIVAKTLYDQIDKLRQEVEKAHRDKDKAVAMLWHQNVHLRDRLRRQNEFIAQLATTIRTAFSAVTQHQEIEPSKEEIIHVYAASPFDTDDDL